MQLDCGRKDMIGQPLTSDRGSNRSATSSANSSRGKSVFRLLAKREICPSNKHVPKRRWGEVSQCYTDPKRGLVSWVEAESLKHLTAKYSPLLPPPRSTIAAAFSPDGKTLASTHGDHTVKIIDCRTGNCLKVLSGHRRTPWVVRFHPLRPEILASGSLDFEVRLWDANTAECIGSRDFYRPIASIAFHAEGEMLAVASGHKLYIWHYKRKGESYSPTIVLKTRRSLRAVHFHPHAAPFLLTAEVNDLDTDSPMTRATSPGYLRYPPPAVLVTNVQSNDRGSLASEFQFMPSSVLFVPSFVVESFQFDVDRHSNTNVMQVESSGTMHVHREATSIEEYGTLVSPSEVYPSAAAIQYPVVGAVEHSLLAGPSTEASISGEDAMETDEMHLTDEIRPVNPSNLTNMDGVVGAVAEVHVHAPMCPSSNEFVQLYPLLPSRDPTWWELPFLQGWLMGQTQAGFSTMLPHTGNSEENLSQDVASTSLPSFPSTNSEFMSMPSLIMPGIYMSDLPGRAVSRHHGSSRSRFYPHESGEARAHYNNAQLEGGDGQPMLNRIQSEIATSLAAAAAELPCTVKLRVWSYDVEHPCAPFSAERCRLTIPYAVLCSEMGAHFSPCGRYLAACVACMLPNMEVDPGLQAIPHHDNGAATSPTRHPISAHQVMYELRIYSLEESTFGEVLVSRAIRAAHCLTSIQFSPTSEHLLLAYGRRHASLLKSIVIDGETTSPIYTVLEIYRVSDMELVKILPNAEDEVNVACFHPFPGGGLVYGTKEGKLRVLQFDGARSRTSIPSKLPSEDMFEVQTYALEG